MEYSTIRQQEGHIIVNFYFRPRRRCFTTNSHISFHFIVFQFDLLSMSLSRLAR
jgi:hypothetical protein